MQKEINGNDIGLHSHVFSFLLIFLLKRFLFSINLISCSLATVCLRFSVDIYFDFDGILGMFGGMGGAGFQSQTAFCNGVH